MKLKVWIFRNLTTWGTREEIENWWRKFENISKIEKNLAKKGTGRTVSICSKQFSLEIRQKFVSNCIAGEISGVIFFFRDTMGRHEFSISGTRVVRAGNKTKYPEDECDSNKVRSSAGYGVSSVSRICST